MIARLAVLLAAATAVIAAPAAETAPAAKPKSPWQLFRAAQMDQDRLVLAFGGAANRVWVVTPYKDARAAGRRLTGFTQMRILDDASTYFPIIAVPLGSEYLTCTTRGATVTVGGSTTSLYNVEPIHVTCAFANRWVSRLSHKRGAAFSGALTGGPSGWHCFATAAGKHGWSGSCTDNTGAKSFSWSPSFTQAPTVTACIAKGAPLYGGSGTSDYKVGSLHNVTCAFARPWVARLTHKRVALAHTSGSHPLAYGRIAGGPPGFECGTMASLVNKLARSGGCHTKAGSKSFNWQPSF